MRRKSFKAIESLHGNMPDAFDIAPLSEDWDEDWLFVPIENPEAFDPDDHSDFALEFAGLEDNESFVSLSRILGAGYPGAPEAERPRSDQSVSPDALAFYLPFHRFYPDWWGIYLTYGGVSFLARELCNYSSNRLHIHEALKLSRLFLFYHEQYHYKVESFSARVEAAYREPLYKTGFRQVYKSTFGTNECIEEALANGFAYQRTISKSKLVEIDKEIASEALHAYISNSLPGYRRGVEVSSRGPHLRMQAELSEEYLQASVNIGQPQPEIWNAFPQSHSPLAPIKARTYYIVHRNSPLAQRAQLADHFLSHQELTKKLRRHRKCVPVGHGRHEKWQCPGTKPFPVPRHPGDMAKGTLAKIIKQAGFDCSVSEFKCLK